MFDYNSKILVIDDFLTMRKIVQKALKDLGFTNIQTAKHGLQAWELINEQPIDIVISDWNMPNMTGLELLKNIRNSEHSKMPFIMVTAESEKSQKADAADAGVDGYLIKPFSPDDIETVLKEVHGKIAERLAS